MKSGIYIIKSIINNKIYIGSSINVKRRQIDHINKLRANKHPNIKLQRHYNKYGEKDLVFNIIEYCDKSKLIELEQKYIDIKKPFFNINKIAGNCLGRKCTEKQLNALKIGQSNPEVIKKRILTITGKKRNLTLNHINNIKKARKEYIYSEIVLEKMKNSSHSKPIIQYDLENNIIREWHCSKCASKELNISCSTIKGCLNNHKNRKTAGGFIWKYKNTSQL